ncbi:MAG: rhomboid family intramembrane serine protease [Desulfuromonadales bacterium]
MTRETEQPPAATAWLSIPRDLQNGDATNSLARRRAHDWALVLEARGIPYQLERCGLGVQLRVAEENHAAAIGELKLFEQENRNWPPPLPAAEPETGNTLANLSALLLLAIFHNLTYLNLDLFGHSPVDWIALGNADAGKIRAGEWWRLLTALTLHADWLHLLGNLAIGGIFIIRLSREIGSGLAWSLLLSAGALGNLLNALLQAPDHRAVGASTAVFGAVGIFASFNLVRYRRRLWRRWPLPVAAALALLALLGAGGERTDIGAHLFGFAAGLFLGRAVAHWLRIYGRPGEGLNFLLALAGGAILASAWWKALGGAW